MLIIIIRTSLVGTVAMVGAIVRCFCLSRSLLLLLLWREGEGPEGLVEKLRDAATSLGGFCKVGGSGL